MREKGRKRGRGKWGNVQRIRKQKEKGRCEMEMGKRMERGKVGNGEGRKRKC